MIAELLTFLPYSQSMLWTGFAVFLRVGAMISVMPAFGDQAVPMRVRLALSIMFTLIVAPVAGAEFRPAPDNLVESISRIGPEVLTGLFFGILLRFFIFALQIAGSIAAQSTSLAQIFGGSAGVDPLPAIGHLLVVAGTALAALSGLHVQASIYIVQSYALVPLGEMISSDVVSTAGLAKVAKTFGLGFSLAAPFLIASLVYNVVLGVINRAMPQLMVSFVGAPAITAGGLLLLLITAPIMLSIWLLAFGSFIENPFGT